MKGSLIVAGTGIRLGHISQEALTAIQSADTLVFCIADPMTKAAIEQIRSNCGRSPAEDLHPLYADGKPRSQTYAQMVERILTLVRGGGQVAALFYGHPGVFAYPSHESIRRARAEGYLAEMLPGISAADCLYADLGIDPSTAGCQMMEATDFLVRRRQLDPTSDVLLWQIGCVGHSDFQSLGYDLQHLSILVEALLKFYPAEHEVIVYQAAHFALCEPLIERVALQGLAQANVTAVSTLYIPAAEKPTLDQEVMARLGLVLSVR